MTAIISKPPRTKAPKLDSLYVKTGELAKRAPLVIDAPSVVIEMGSDNGPTAVGLLRLVEINDAGKITGVYLEAGDNLTNTLIQSDHGFRIIQGQSAAKEYERYLERTREYVSKSVEEINAGRMPPDIAEAIASALSERLMDSDDVPGEEPPDTPIKH